MSKTVKVYNGDEVSSSLGPVLHDGKGIDSFIEVEWESDITEDEVGVDGEVVVTRTNDERSDVKVTLMATSDANDGMATLANLAITSPGMASAVVPYRVRDPNGRTVLAAANAWVKARPATKFSRKVEMKVWTIRCAHLKGFEGGS